MENIDSLTHKLPLRLHVFFPKQSFLMWLNSFGQRRCFVKVKLIYCPSFINFVYFQKKKVLTALNQESQSYNHM